MKLDSLKAAVAMFNKGNATKAYALRSIRDDKLYLEDGYETFKECAEDRLGIQESYAYKLIRYLDYLDWVELDIWTDDPLPTEGAIRPLVSHSAKRPDLAEKVYAEALRLADDEPADITADIAKQAIKNVEAESGATTIPTNEKGEKKRREKSESETLADKLERNIKYQDRDFHDPEEIAGEAVETYLTDHDQVTAHELRQFVAAEITRITFIRQWLNDYETELNTRLADALAAQAA